MNQSHCSESLDQMELARVKITKLGITFHKVIESRMSYNYCHRIGTSISPGQPDLNGNHQNQRYRSYHHELIYYRDGNHHAALIVL